MCLLFLQIIYDATLMNMLMTAKLSLGGATAARGKCHAVEVIFIHG